MKYLRLAILVTLIGFSLNANAGGIKSGAVVPLFIILIVLFLIFIVIPSIIGTIAAVLSKTRKKHNFFLGFLIALTTLLLLALVVSNF